MLLAIFSKNSNKNTTNCNLLHKITSICWIWMTFQSTLAVAAFLPSSCLLACLPASMAAMLIKSIAIQFEWNGIELNRFEFIRSKLWNHCGLFTINSYQRSIYALQQLTIYRRRRDGSLLWYDWQNLRLVGVLLKDLFLQDCCL